MQDLFYASKLPHSLVQHLAKSRFSLHARKSDSISSSREKPSSRNRISLSSYSGIYLCKLSPKCA